MAAIRLIFLGMPVKEAAEHIGISRTFMSTVYRSEVGQEYLKHLMGITNSYVAAMVALGLTPADIVGDGKPVTPRPLPDIRRAVAVRSRCIGAKRRVARAPRQ